MKTVAQVLARALSPDQLVNLGHLLVAAGNAARAKQKAIDAALDSVSVAVSTLLK